MKTLTILRTHKVLASLASLAVLVGQSACGEPEAHVPSEGSSVLNARAAIAVDTLRAELGTLTIAISASGSIEARRIAEIGPEVPGRIVAVHVDVGDQVAAGDLLFELDPTPYELALAEAQAGLALARAESRHAASDADRVRKLEARSAASESNVDQMRTEAAVAHARVAQAEARLARAERDLSSSSVVAPWAGSVVERRAHEGTFAGDSPIVVLQESGVLEAVLTIPEASPVPVRVGDPVSLWVDGLREPIRTHVDRVSDRVDPRTRTYRVRAPVPTGEAQPARAFVLKAGSFVRAELQPSANTLLPTLERSAVLMRDGRSYVFHVERGDTHTTAVRTVVRLGAGTAERVQVLSGVDAGDELVRGAVVRRLADGAHLDVAAPLARAEAP